MTSSEALQRFGLPASPQHHQEIRRCLVQEIERERTGTGGEELLKTLCAQLFSLGVVEDALLIWEAKQSSFDAGCSLEIQLLCGAGLPATKEFLARSTAPTAAAALRELTECDQAGDFADWTPSLTIEQLREYYVCDDPL